MKSYTKWAVFLLISISYESIFSRCLDCSASKATNVRELDNNHVELRNALQKFIEARSDVIEEQKQMTPLSQVQGWLSRLQAVEIEETALKKLRIYVLGDFVQRIAASQAKKVAKNGTGFG